MDVRDREKLLARIRKLYAMSQESVASPHEAEIALRRCQSLMNRFGITEADLAHSEFGASKVGKVFRSVPSYLGVLGSAVALIHDCLCVKGDTIEFRGFSIDADVAALTYSYLVRVMDRSLKDRKSNGTVAPGRTASFDYRVGFALAVLERARQMDRERKAAEQQRTQQTIVKNDPYDATGSSLVLRKRDLVRQACMQGLVTGRAKRIRYRNGSAHTAGSHDGARVSLDKQLDEVPRKAVSKSV